MNEDRLPSPGIHGRRLALQQAREAALALPPEKALERILEHPEPAALVHSFPAQDLHLLIHEIGPDDGLPLLALASDGQLEYILDQEAWRDDRVHPPAADRWLERLLAAAPGRTADWLARTKTEWLELYLFRNLEIRLREHDQDPSDFGEGFFSLDDTLYFRIRPDPSAGSDDALPPERRNGMLQTLLTQVAETDYARFHRLALESSGILPAETEEEEYRLRRVRLAEKGFLPFDEAVGLYQPLAPGRLPERPHPARRAAAAPAPEAALAVVPLRLAAAAGVFHRALEAVTDPELMLQLQAEYAALSNRLIVADRLAVRTREDLKTAVDKVAGFLGIGLELLEAAGRPAAEAVALRHARLLCAHPLESLFRLGYGEALRLKQRAEKWLAGSWFAARGLGLAFWGEAWFGLLGGLLLKRPRFFDNYRRGVLYREFERLEEIQATEALQSQIEDCDRLLAAIDLPLVPPDRRGFLTYKRLLLTAWARSELGLGERTAAPLTLAQLREFFDGLFAAPPAGSGAARPLREDAPERLQRWAVRAAGLEPEDVDRLAGAVLTNLLLEVQSEYGAVTPADLDPRFVHLFALAPPLRPTEG